MCHEERLLHIELLHSGIVLSKKSYSGWREIQDEYDDYMTSLGPYTVDEVINFVREEWPDLHCEEEIAEFARSDRETLSI